MTSVLVWLRAHVALVAVVLVLLSCAGAAGHFFHPRTVEVVKWQTKEVAHDVVRTVTVEKPVTQWRTRTLTKTVYLPGTTSPATVTVVTENSGSKSGGSTVTASDTLTQTTASAGSTVSTSGQLPERWSVQVLLGASTSGGYVVGAAAQYRLVGPLTLGLWSTIPLAAPSLSAGVSVGLRL